jgi:Domain of unknown function (DUF4123)
MTVEIATEDLIEAIGDQLFSDEAMNVFAVLDGASVSGLLDKLYDLAPEFLCLFKGDLTADMAEVAPYLVKIEPDSEFTAWLIGQGWGKHWGVYALTHADLRATDRHLRSLLLVFDESGRPLRFRYYDPRVLRTYLPTCTAEELGAVFGPIGTFLVEEEDTSTVLRFQFSSGLLKQKRISV